MSKGDKMKLLFNCLIFCWLTNFSYSEAISPTEIHAQIKEVLPQGWQMVSDHSNLIIYREKKVEFLNPVSLPAKSHERLLKEYGWKESLIVKLRFVPKLHKDELQKIINIRSEQIKKIKDDITIHDKSKYGLLAKIRQKFLVPQYFNTRYSIYLHRTDRGNYPFWPKEARNELQIILKKLNLLMKKYDHK